MKKYVFFLRDSFERRKNGVSQKNEKVAEKKFHLRKKLIFFPESTSKKTLIVEFLGRKNEKKNVSFFPHSTRF